MVFWAIKILGLAQAVMVQLLMHFGEKGLDENIMEMRRYFTHRKKEFFSICEKLLRPDNLVEWEVPLAGMFCWFKLKGKVQSNYFFERSIC